MPTADAAPRNLRQLFRFVAASGARIVEDRSFQMAGSLTYTTLLSLVPLVTVALSMISAFPVFREWTGRVDDYMLQNVLPQAVGKLVLGYFEQFAQAAARLTALGVVVLGATAVMLMLTIDRAFNQIFRVIRPKPLLQRLLIYWAVLTLGPLLIGVSLSMTSYLVSVSLGLTRGLPLAGEALLRLVPLVLTAAALTLLYRVVPNRNVQLRHALLGGLIAGLLFELVKRGFGLYVARMPTYTAVYGAFAAVPIFLIWLYLSWFVVIYGATITAMLPGYRIVLRGERRAGESLLEAVALLEMLLAAHREGGAMPLHQLARSTAVAPEVADRLLLHMQARGWVAKTGGDRWMLARDSEEIRLIDLAQAYLLDPATAGALALRWPAFAALDESLDALTRRGNPSLRELLAAPAASTAA